MPTFKQKKDRFTTLNFRTDFENSVLRPVFHRYKKNTVTMCYWLANISNGLTSTRTPIDKINRWFPVLILD